MARSILPLCPDCRGPLGREAAVLLCVRCAREFIFDEGIPVLLPSELDRFKEEEIAYHDGVHEEFDDLHSMDAPRVSAFKEEYHERLSRLAAGSLVLELGCGTGWDAARLAGRGLVVYLGDISPAMVKKARQRLRGGKAQSINDKSQRKIQIPNNKYQTSKYQNTDGEYFFFVFDAESIPFPDESFDAVLITAALHHMESPAACMAEMARVCRPGGTVILGFEPNGWPYFTVLPARRLIAVAAKAGGAFIRSPRGALRKARELRFARGSLVERKGAAREPFSPGDRRARGFGRGAIMRLLNGAGLEPVSVSPVWYFNGFIQEFQALRGLRNPSPGVQKLLVRIDRALARLPLIRLANWHWNVIARKQGHASPFAPRMADTVGVGFPPAAGRHPTRWRAPGRGKLDACPPRAGIKPLQGGMILAFSPIR